MIEEIESYNFVDSVEYRGVYIDNIEDKNQSVYILIFSSSNWNHFYFNSNDIKYCETFNV